MAVVGSCLVGSWTGMSRSSLPVGISEKLGITSFLRRVSSS